MQANTFFWFMVTDQPAEFTKMLGSRGANKEKKHKQLMMESKQRVGGV